MASKPKLTDEQKQAYVEATSHVRAAVAEWHALRKAVADTEWEEHPPITDKFGRIWYWRRGDDCGGRSDLYVHDDTMAIPGDWLRAGRVGLPLPGLADTNPNYSKLCSICRREDTDGSRAQPS